MNFFSNSEFQILVQSKLVRVFYSVMPKLTSVEDQSTILAYLKVKKSINFMRNVGVSKKTITRIAKRGRVQYGNDYKVHQEERKGLIKLKRKRL